MIGVCVRCWWPWLLSRRLLPLFSDLEVRVLEANVPAQLFWAGAIEMFTGAVIHPVRIEKDGEDWFVFAFESKRVP